LTKVNRWRESHERYVGGVRQGESTADGDNATSRREYGRRPAGRVKSLEDRIVFLCVYVCTCVLVISVAISGVDDRMYGRVSSVCDIFTSICFSDDCYIYIARQRTLNFFSDISSKSVL